MKRMSILQTHSCHSSYNRLKYVFNEPVHSYQKTDKRVLAATGFNIKMLHDNDGRISVTQNGAYLERQFRIVLKRAHNPKRCYQAQTIIISFDPSEFDTSDLRTQSQQALRLVQNYVRKHFADCQSVIAIQADGEDGKIHAHVVMNTIRTSGKTVATNGFNIQKLRKDFDEEMQTSYQKVTCRQWTNPVHNQTDRKDIHNLTTKSEWQHQLKDLITKIKNKVDNIADFLKQLEQHGVTVTERQKGKAWTYHQTVTTKTGCRELKVRDFYQRVDKRTGEIKATRGLGRSFSKSAIEAYFKAKNGKKIYLEIIKDLATKQVLTWAISEHPNLRFALTPLQKLLKQLPQTGYQLTLHTDQGWHYQHRAWRKLLRKGKIRQSMSHRATCLDNAACETVFSKLKAEIGQDTSYRGRDELIQAIEEWLHFYNERRI